MEMNMAKKKLKKKTTKKDRSSYKHKPTRKKNYDWGRPLEYEDYMADQLYDSLCKGYSIEASCAFIGPLDDEGEPRGISKDTMYRWLEEYENFSYAQKRGSEKGRQFWEGLGVRHITHHPQGMQLNSAVYCFNMKNRYGWKDKPEEKEDGIKKPFKLSYNLDEE